MTTTQEIEDRLRVAGAVDLRPDAARRLDTRIAQLAAARPQDSRAGVGRRTILRPLLLAAAVLTAAGATGSILGLYDAMGGAGYHVGWTRGARLELSQTVGDYRVTLHRAYADANELMLAVSVAGTPEADVTQLGVFGARVVDETGAKYEARSGGSSPVGSDEAANVMWFRPPEMPLAAGRRHFTVTVPNVEVRDNSSPPPTDAGDWDPWYQVAGPWTFEFDLEVAGGVDVRPDAVAQAAGATLSVERVVTSPTAVLLTLRMADLPERDWAPIAELTHNGRALVGGAMAGVGGNVIELSTSEGVDDPSGEWSLVVTELVGEEADGQVRLQGPWRLDFTIP